MHRIEDPWTSPGTSAKGGRHLLDQRISIPAPHAPARTQREVHHQSRDLEPVRSGRVRAVRPHQCLSVQRGGASRQCGPASIDAAWPDSTTSYRVIITTRSNKPLSHCGSRIMTRAVVI